MARTSASVSLRNLTAGAALLALGNSAFLALSESAALFHYLAVGLHVVLGALAPALVLLAARRGRYLLGLAGVGTAIVLVATVETGAYLAWVGGGLAHANARVVHGAIGGVAALSVALWLFVTAGRERAFMASRPVAVMLLAAVAALVSRSVALRAGAEGRRAASERITNPALPPTEMEGEGGGTASPFFPSSARTTTGGTMPADFFLTSQECGRCHRDIYEQWNISSHHFSSFNNQWYRKSIEYM